MAISINAKLLKQFRELKNWTQEDVAKASNLDVRSIQRIESTGKLSSASLSAIADALNVDGNLLIIADKHSNKAEDVNDEVNIWLEWKEFFCVSLGTSVGLGVALFAGYPIFQSIVLGFLAGMVLSVFGPDATTKAQRIYQNKLEADLLKSLADPNESKSRS